MVLAIIVRMAFEKELTPIQIRQFKDVFLKSVGNQTRKDFKVYILADQVRNFKGSRANRTLIEELTKDYPNIYVKDPERRVFDIEVRCDFDDELAPNFVEKVFQEAERPQSTFLLSFQPIIVDSNTGTKYKNPQKYDSKGASMCCALIQKGEKKFGVYDRPHIKMPSHVGICHPIGEGYFFLHAHGENLLTKIPCKAVPIRQI